MTDVDQGKFPDDSFGWDDPAKTSAAAAPKKRDDEYRLKTEGGYVLDEVISALTKEIRRGDEDKALYWTLELCQGGYAKYFFRRMSVLVAEEIGLADPMATVLLNATAQCYERRAETLGKGPHTTELLGQLILYFCRAPKSHEAAMAAYAVEEERNAGRKDPIPEYAVDMHTKAGREKIAAKGMSKRDAALWFWQVLWKLKNVAPGNRWIKRMVGIERDLPADDPETAAVYQEQLGFYSEVEENQL